MPVKPAMMDGESVDNESVLRNNLTVFLPYISQCVDAKDLLANMTCFTREERKNIFATSLRNKMEAIHTALNVVLSKSEEGLFFEFKEAMEHAGYPKIVKMLCGEHVEDDTHFQRLIDLFTDTLIKSIRPMELLPHLLQSRVLMDQESEEVRSEEMNHGSIRACWILLFHLPRRVEDWFTLFMKALVESNHGEVAEFIDPDLFEKLKAQAEFRRKESQTVLTVEEVLVDNEQDQGSHDFQQTLQQDGRIRYTRKVLLECRRSPLSHLPPHGMEKMPDIWSPPPVHDGKGPAHRTGVKQSVPEDDCKLVNQPGQINSYVQQTGSTASKHSVQDGNTLLKLPNNLTDNTLAKQTEPIADSHSVKQPVKDINKTLQQPVQDDNNSVQQPIAVATNHLKQQISDDNNSKQQPVADVNNSLQQPTLDNNNSVQQPSTDDNNTVQQPKIDDNDKIHQLVADENSLQQLVIDDNNSVQQPLTDDNNSVQQPEADDNSVQQPVADDNSLQQPLTDENNSVHQPLTDDNSVQQPLTDDNNSVHQPLTDDNIALQQPVQQPLTDDNSVQQPLTDDNSVHQPLTDDNIALQQPVQQPLTDDNNSVQQQLIDNNIALQQPVTDDNNSVQQQLIDNNIALQQPVQQPLTDDNNSVQQQLIDNNIALQQPVTDDNNSVQQQLIDNNIALQQPLTDDNNSVQQPLTDDNNSVQQQLTDNNNALLQPVVDDNNSIQQPVADDNNRIQQPVADDNFFIQRVPDEDFFVQHTEPADDDSTTVKQPLLVQDNAGLPGDGKNQSLTSGDLSMDGASLVEGAVSSPNQELLRRYLERLEREDFGNDLNAPEEKILNTDTDLDEIPPEKNEEDLFPQLRGYQKELAREGADGENTIVLAPTNTGKTWVACYIIQEHLRRCVQAGRNGKVVFIVDNEALAIQQGNLCTENLPAHRTKVITGSTQRDKGQYLRDFVNRRDILVVTAMVLVNSLREREIADLTTFSLLLFDECHHSNDNHPYNQILKRYRRLKLLDQVDLGTLPQVVGLTASLGVGGNTNIEKAIDHMKQIMANMDAKFLSIVRSKQGLDEMKGYENPPDEEIETAPPRQDDFFKLNVVQTMDIIDATIQTHPSMLNLRGKDSDKKMSFMVPDCKGSEQFIQWVTNFKTMMVSLNSMEARTFLDPCRQHLEVYNKALMIHKDARVVDALKLLDHFMEDELERQIRPECTQIENDLLALYKELAATDYGTVSENPKLLKMQDLLLSNLGDGENSRGIIFVRTKELVNALVAWLNENEKLKHLNADKFVGKNASASSGGMTRSGQGDALQYFKDGRHKVIVATSVAEEGLDITKCNLVIRYEHVTNEIVRVQSKGRARAPNSRYYVLTEEGSWITAKEEKNAMLEDLMKRLVPRLHRWIAGNTNQWEGELRRLQQELLNAERLAEQRRAEARSPDQMQLQCVHCSNFICMSDELRKVQNAHHIVVADDIMERVVAERSPVPQFAEDDIQMDGDVYCMNCQSRLGGVLSYKNVEFPLLVIANFRVVDKNGRASTAKKWKKVNFRITPFTLDDLDQILIKKLQEE